MIDDAKFIEICTSSISVGEALKKQGLKPSGGNYKTFYLRVQKLNINLGHFLGKRHGKSGHHKLIPLSAILVKNSTYSNNDKLKKRLIKAKLLPDCCMECGITKWLNESIPLHLHHVNGHHFDNRLKNLVILCPNCHTIYDRRLSALSNNGNTNA